MDAGADPRDLEVPPAPVRDPRGGRPAGIVALAGITAVIVAAIGIAQVVPQASTPSPRASAAPSGIPAPAAPSGIPTSAATLPSGVATLAPDPSAILAGSPPRLSREDLNAAVLDGSLDGRLVFVGGVMRATRTACDGEAPASRGCVDLQIPGIGVPVLPGGNSTPWPGEPPLDAWLVTLARDGRLVYLGSLVPSEGGPRTIDGIVQGFGPRGRDWTDGTLFEVDGYLVTDPVRGCGMDAVDATPCPAPSPFLAYDDPLADGILASDAGTVVELSASMPEVDPDTVVTAGTFLLVPPDDDAGPWRVVARYEPSRSVRVLVP